MKKRKIIIFAIMIILLIAATIIGITMTNAANSATAPETEQTFTEDGDGYYIWVRAVDHAGNKGPWSEAQRVWIDSKPPIVTCTEANNTLTITEGDVVTLADYFTVDPNGKNTNITKTCTINGTKYETTDGITEGTYTVTCTAAKESGLSAEATMTLVVEAGWKVGVSLSAADVAANPELYSGIEIKGYTCTNSAGVNAWKIFYADSSNIYLIADNYIHYDYTPADRKDTKPDGSGYMMYFSSIYSHYDGSANILDTSITDSRIQKWIDYASYKSTAANANIKSVAYMLDCNVWKVYKDNTYADYAIGGPTVEMFADAYDWAHPGTDIGYDHKFDYGYKVGTGGTATADYISGLNTSDSTYVISATDRAYGYWLASPSAGSTSSLMYVYYIGALGNRWCDSSGYMGFRPLVCLKEGVTLETIAGEKAKLVAPMVQVEAKQAEVTVNYGDNVSFDSLFTVTTRDGGTSEIYYAVDGINGPLVNCSELEVGTHTLTCTATYNGVTDTAYTTVVVNSAVPEEDTLLAEYMGNGSVTFEVPTGVNVLKISAYDGDALSEDGSYIVSYYEQQIVKGTSSEHLDTIYVAVTPGKSYELQTSGSSGGGVYVYYSQSINEQTPTFDLDALNR